MSLTPTYIGKTIKIKGDVVGDENIVVDGMIEGTVRIKENLTVSQGGQVKAEISAKSVQVSGTVSGSIDAIDKVDVAPTGVMNGNIKAPRFIVSQGGVLNGNIQMPMPDGSVVAPIK
jgi:cytoskeletal protein CcmA (bactofilin family)